MCVLYLTEESARLACGLTLHSMSLHSPDILKRHATQAMPLAFFAMHEQKPGKLCPNTCTKSTSIENVHVEDFREVLKAIFLSINY